MYFYIPKSITLYTFVTFLKIFESLSVSQTSTAMKAPVIRNYDKLFMDNFEQNILHDEF